MIGFQNPLYLLAIPILIIILYRLLKKELVSYDDRYAEESSARIKQSRRKKILFFTRSLVIILIVAAIAGPTTSQDLFRDADPRIDVLIDESASMDVFAQTTFIERLREEANVRTSVIAIENTSALSDAILSELQPGGHVILLSDGQTSSGADLSSVASYAEGIQATLNGLELTLRSQDASVLVEADEVVTEQSPTQIRIQVQSTDDKPRTVETTIDGERIDTRLAQEPFIIQREFSRGEHTIQARIIEDDDFMINNQYVATITATPKVRVLLLTQRASDFETLLQDLYRVESQSRLPQNLDEYAAIILYDTPRSVLRGRESDLQAYFSAGGGMVAVGGENSFEYGNYKDTLLESMLPVRVGAGAYQQPSANIVVAIDLSNSALGSVKFVDGQQVQATEEVQSVQKALAVDLLNRLNLNNRVGALGFTYPQPREDGCTGACVLGRVQALGENKQELIDRIARVNITGGTSLSTGMQGSIKLLEQVAGSQNIVLISDGVTGGQDAQQALEAAQTFRARGGTVYTVHVGNSNNGFSFMQQLAEAGGGIGFSADKNNRLAVLFGEPQETGDQDALGVVAVDEYHYITRGLESTATLFGYNQVLAKSSARKLLASNGGEHVLTVWNYGIGRVAAITGYSQQDLGSLLIPPNSQYIARTVNWAIGPLEAVQDEVIVASDARIGADVQVFARGQRPQAEGVRFSRTASNEYKATIPATKIGVDEVAGAQYAVNYPHEYDALGISDDLREAVELTGGRMYDPADIGSIVEHATNLAQIKEVQNTPLSWPFVIAALAIYLLEVCIRRIASMKRS